MNYGEIVEEMLYSTGFPKHPMRYDLFVEKVQEKLGIIHSRDAVLLVSTVLNNLGKESK